MKVLVPLAAALAVLGGPVLALAAPTASMADNVAIPVTNTFDAGPGSLRGAVEIANALPGPDTVVIALPPHYVINLTTSVLSTDALTVLGNGITLTIEGPPQAMWTHSGGSPLTIYQVSFTGTQVAVVGINSDGPVSIGSSTFTNLVGGGAVSGTDVDVVDSAFVGNTRVGHEGGAIEASGDLTILGSSLIDNSTGTGVSACAGGGAFSGGAVRVDRSLFQGNTGGGAQGCEHFGGGALSHDADPSAPLTITNSAFLQNTSYIEGGAAFSTTAAAPSVQNTTIAGNTNVSNTVGAVNATGTLDLRFVTFTGNTNDTAGQPADVSANELISFASVFGGTTSAHCAVAGSASGTYNVEQAGSSCGLDDSTSLQHAADPGLGAVGDNGGPTPSAVPVAGSLLIDRIPAGNGWCTGTDQRGVSRPQGVGCDVGAVEAGGTVPAVVAGVQLRSSLRGSGSLAEETPSSDGPSAHARSSGPRPEAPVSAVPRFTG